MKGIPNPKFWSLWNQHKYKEALQEPLQPLKNQQTQNPMQSFLFGNAEELKQSFSIGVISTGEFLFDYFRIDPLVMEGVDFSRAEDLSSFFTYSEFADSVNIQLDTGDIAQMQGYVAERMVAAELQAKGYDVEFPETSNQAGYDLLVDGAPFQVKNLLSPEGVKEHLQKYPDIPVYVNEELANTFENHPMVYATHVQHAEVVQATKDSLLAAEDLTDFEIPYISLLVSTISQTKRLIFDETSLGQAVFNVFSDTSSKVVMGTIGQHAVSAAGLFLFGPAGGLIGSGVGAILGASQGWRLSMKFKSLLAREEEAALIHAIEALTEQVRTQVDRKIDYKQNRLGQILRGLDHSEAGHVLAEDLTKRANAQIVYVQNKKLELQVLLEAVRTGEQPVLTAIEPLLGKVAQSGVHPPHYQQELRTVTELMKVYLKKQ
ncbi:hypothetical protein [Paenibacillus sp. FSL R5-0912]|uniref:hypothetical protein n=1 Tax=Paenibacillus sp. FSL R5-0912 TaxID=1536771 RepID=UPI0004F82084|nr:hypothetical protein [Paenibacillus sp. FSL R5-0912]AIQ39921.1 hypothetical protein R50912_07690 [Paenibacillus sp. FSL R5-0912]